MARAALILKNGSIRQRGVGRGVGAGHGECGSCSDPHTCGKDHHRDDCARGCIGHARSCRQRTGGGLHLTELKSAKGRRTIALPPQLVAALKAHRTAQLQERMTTGPIWHDGDFVWCQPNGRPIGAHADWDEWNDLLKAALSAGCGFMMPGTPRPLCCLLRALISAS